MDPSLCDESLDAPLCIGMVLKENNSLKKLNLRKCELQPEGLEQVIKGVQVNTKLESLNLSGNTIDNQSASCLGKCSSIIAFSAHIQCQSLRPWLP